MRALGTALSPSDEPCFCKRPSPKTNIQCRVAVRVPPGGMGRRADTSCSQADHGQSVPSGPWTNQGSPPLEEAMGTSLHKGGWVLPALTAFGLLRRDGNRLHACPLPCLSCCLRQRPSFLTPPRGIYYDSKTSTKSKAKGSLPPQYLLTRDLTWSSPVDMAHGSHTHGIWHMVTIGRRELFSQWPTKREEDRGLSAGLAMVTLVGCKANLSPWGPFLFRSTPISEGVSSSVIPEGPTVVFAAMQLPRATAKPAGQNRSNYYSLL